MADYEGSGCCHKYAFAHEAGHYPARFPYHTSEDGLLMTPEALGRRLLKFDGEDESDIVPIGCPQSSGIAAPKRDAGSQRRAAA